MINFCIAQALKIFIEHRSTGFQGIIQAQFFPGNTMEKL